MAQVRRGDRIHVFESLSDLQPMRCASRSTILHSRQPAELRAAEANVPHAKMQHLQ